MLYSACVCFVMEWILTIHPPAFASGSGRGAVGFL